MRRQGLWLVTFVAIAGFGVAADTALAKKDEVCKWSTTKAEVFGTIPAGSGPPPGCGGSWQKKNVTWTSVDANDNCVCIVEFDLEYTTVSDTDWILYDGPIEPGNIEVQSQSSGDDFVWQDTWTLICDEEVELRLELRCPAATYQTMYIGRKCANRC